MNKDDLVRQVTCRCGYTNLMYPLGDPVWHRCPNCGSKEAYKQVEGEFDEKYFSGKPQ